MTSFLSPSNNPTHQISVLKVTSKYAKLRRGSVVSAPIVSDSVQFGRTRRQGRWVAPTPLILLLPQAGCGRTVSLHPKSGSWNDHGVEAVRQLQESTTPVEKRPAFQMLYPLLVPLGGDEIHI